MEAEGGAVHPSKGTICTAYSSYRTTGHFNLSQFDIECYKSVAEKMCEESGVNVIYHMLFVGCDTENGEVKAAYYATQAFTKSKQRYLWIVLVTQLLQRQVA